jgi:serine/threonine protein kinase
MADDKPGAAERTQLHTGISAKPTPQSSESGTLFRPSQMGVATAAPAANTASTASTNSSSNSSDWQLTNPSQWSSKDDIVLGIGSVLKERFVLERVVGKGGMGTVFCARDRRKEEAQDRFPYVAVKILNEDFKRHPESLKLLQREARKAQQLAHPNIVTTFDFDRDGGNVFIVMELLQGQSLDRVIKQTDGRGMSFADALQIVGALCQALGYAHKKNVIHSDFKPANAYVLEDGTVKILDFGIARAKTRTDAPEAEQTKFRVDDLGALTPSYASLEMLDGDDPDPRDDLYALACVTYELLTGKHPFGRQPAKFAMEYNLKLVRPKGLSSRRWAALKRALAFKREDRTPSAEAFFAELASDQRSPVWSWGIAASGVAMIAGAVYWTVQQQAEQAVTASSVATPVQPIVATPVAPAAPTSGPTTAQVDSQEDLTNRRKEWLLQIAKANDVQTAIDVLHELRTQLPSDDVFVTETGPQAIANANLRLADRALQRGSYSAAGNYLDAAQKIYPTVSGLQPRQEALTTIATLDSSLRNGTPSVDTIRRHLMQIEEVIPATYPAVEENLANTFAERIRRTRQSNAPAAATLLTVATQTFGQAPAIVALNKSMETTKQPEPRVVQPAPPPAPTPAIEKPVEQPPATQNVKPEPAPQPAVQQPVTPPPAAPKVEEKPKKKPDVIITF